MVLPSTDESLLDDVTRYKHVGWVTDVKNCFPSSMIEAEKYLVDLNNVISENTDKVFYACYVEENVKDSITDLLKTYYINSKYKYNNYK